MDLLEAISPIDGRYRKHTEPLADIFSEKGLIGNRIRVEGEYLIALSEHPQIGTREFSVKEKKLIRKLYNVSLRDAQIVKDIEIKGYGNIKPTNHDVKAVEYYMKEKLRKSSLEDSLEWIHFALTSEDVNNIAYALMLRDGFNDVLLPSVEKLYKTIFDLSKKYKSVPMLARTHGQPASPTTFGKEFHVFSNRLIKQVHKMRHSNLFVKLNGASGNYNAHYAAYPDVDWIDFTREFILRFNDVGKLGFIHNSVTTQIEPHDSHAQLFDDIRRINNIVLDFNQDMWRYISDGWIVQKPVEGEVGSSTMPHKVNPIDFENSEGNLGLANVLLSYFSDKLPISRLQRDLSDSTVERNFGVAFGHSLIGYKSTLRGLSKMVVDESKVIKELRNHPEVISEAIQTILRREGVEMPYEQLKDLTRGKKPTMRNFRIFIDELNISKEVKKELRKLKPTNYIGIAETLVEF